MLLRAVGAGTSLGLLKFSRKHESEADYMGLVFMAMAGYDPRQAPEFWKRMTALKGGEAPPEFLSTHPSDERRIADLNKKMPEALKYFEKSAGAK
jgi:predicted Zn-dependent protease